MHCRERDVCIGRIGASSRLMLHYQIPLVETAAEFCICIDAARSMRSVSMAYV
jgi:hypothetical protein